LVQSVHVFLADSTTNHRKRHEFSIEISFLHFQIRNDALYLAMSNFKFMFYNI
jgi:hypothetical protein